MVQYRRQAAVAATTAASVAKLWRRVGDDFDSGWGNVRLQVNAVVTAGRAASVRLAVPYTQAVLAETGQVAEPVGVLAASRFLDSAPDGRPMESLLDGGLYHAKARVAAGASTSEALASAGQWLTGSVLTALADTRRGVYQADIIQRPTLTGYTRMLNAPSCSRCVILAGKWFRWNQGFLRHPRCDCIHIPASEDVAGDFRTDPDEYFHSLTPEAQVKVFGKSEARAVNDGADLNRVVNIKQRGLGTAASKKRYGTPSRFTVDDIYRVAGTRTNAIKLMAQEGYITVTPARLNQLLSQ